MRLPSYDPECIVNELTQYYCFRVPIYDVFGEAETVRFWTNVTGENPGRIVDGPSFLFLVEL